MEIAIVPILSYTNTITFRSEKSKYVSVRMTLRRSRMAELNFLSEKFAPNNLPEIYAPRRVLLSAFNRAAEYGVVYVGAPAGSGKTVSTLLWLADSGRKPVWIGLDAYDNSPSVFYKQLATGIFSTQPENGAMKQVLIDPAFSATPVQHMVQLIAEMIPEEKSFALVLDDMHTITNGEIRKSLPSVIRRLPRSFVVLILSRHELPEEFSPLLHDCNIQIITPNQLRFSEDEIREYFSSLGRFLTPEESRYAYQATEGWAMGVTAMAKSSTIDPRNDYIFDHYFQVQVWDQWDEPLRNFCLATAIVDEFDIALASILSGCGNAGEIMEQLSRTNSFLSRLHGDTYRYHHLFLDFLREQVSKSRIDNSALYKKAAVYYREHKDYSRALRFWLESGDYKGIDTYLYLFLFENNKGIIADYADFLRTFFVKDFPQEAFRQVPALHVLSAWYYYLTSRHQEFEAHMDAIYKALPRIALGDSKFVEYAILAYSVDHRTGMLTKLRQFKFFGRYVKKFTSDGLATNIASFSHNMPYMHRSNLDYSDLALDPQSVEKLDKTFAVLLGAEWNYIKYGITACFSYERGRLEEALAENDRALKAFGDENKDEGLICMLILKHSILWRLRRYIQARNVFEQLSDVSHTTAQFFIPNLKAYQARLELWSGSKTAASSWLEQYFVVETDHIELFRSFQHFTTARAYIVLEDTENALKYCGLLKDFGKNVRRPLDLAEACVLLASLYWATGKKKEAETELEEALCVLQPFGFILTVADEGAAILPVLKRLRARINRDDYKGSLQRAYVQEVMLAAHETSKQHKGIACHLAASSKPVKLSGQQKRMIELLAQGYRNSEICELTGLKLSTVKTHTAMAYKKLGVNNAMDAVLKARELRLI